MSKIKPPNKIYLQWVEKGHSENTFCEDRITDDDIEYVNVKAVIEELKEMDVGPVEYRVESLDFLNGYGRAKKQAIEIIRGDGN